MLRKARLQRRVTPRSQARNAADSINFAGRDAPSRPDVFPSTYGHMPRGARIHRMNQPDTDTNCAKDPLAILLVENHPDMALALSLFLEKHGYSPLTASTVEEALEQLATNSFDVLIADIRLPDGDGWEMLERANLPDSVCTIAMTGNDTRSDEERSASAGYRHHLVKPF